MRLPSARAHLRRRWTPTARRSTAVVAMMVGAWLIAWWAVGVVLMVTAGLYVLLADDGRPGVLERSRVDVLERWKHAR